ncbi:dockerin type I domain-containing protein [Stieleria sp. TO1_6]|uniref:LamG-like jellyroll fold domain-containing protein n=1 Tax=Stieleria tagensis TaxID=2956795 RepID=UPI00209AFF61|nr:LamG-like jellyroll fold domain-containing protein [Stieleria tagensis]MCO8122510.1 dockerin type I domain-containing protein [Stieleria tagensis]
MPKRLIRMESLESRRLLHASSIAQGTNTESAGWINQVATQQAGPQSQPEDVNGDQKVSVLDALLTINQLERSDQNRNATFDVNRDGHLTPLDPLHIVHFLSQTANTNLASTEQPEPEMIAESDAMHHGNGIQVTADSVITLHDTIPRFAANAGHVAVASGDWSDANTWGPTGVPAKDAVVRIPHGLNVRYDIDSEIALDAIEIHGQLDFATNKNTSLWLNELMVMPTGVLTIGTKDDPVASSVSAEIVFTDTPDTFGRHFKTGTVANPGIDPQQFGNGLLSFGTTVAHGSVLEQTFLELEQDISGGDQEILVREQPVGWKVGDEVVFPDTRQINPVDSDGYYDYQGQFETARIASIVGRVITLEAPLQFSHLGPSDADGQPTQGLDGQRVMPHVGNLTRNVTLRSENPDGVRGHTMFFANSVHDVRYTAMEELGRTTVGELDNTQFDSDGRVTKIGSNQVARYSEHFHHLFGPEGGIPLDDSGANYQWISVGNSITGALKWGTAIHASHYGYLGQSVYYDSDGAAVVTEDGSEFENMIEGNFIVRVNGGGGPFSWHGVHRTAADTGDMGDGIWLAGAMNSVHNNVVANAIRNAYIVYTDNVPSVNRSTYRPVQIPLAPGANPHMVGMSREVNVLAEPFDDFHGNEAYGATTAAVWLWSVGDRGHFPDTPGRNTLVDTTVWHVSGSGAYFYYANDHVIDGWLQRGDPDAIGLRITEGGSSKPGTAFTHGGSIAATTEISNANVQGVEIGFRNRGRGVTDEISIRDSYFDNATNFASETWGQFPVDGSRDMEISNVVFGDHLNPGADQNVWMEIRPTLDDAILVPETTTLKNYRGWAGIDLDVYYKEQAPSFIIPETVGGPSAGLSNLDAFTNHGIAVGGRVAPTQEVDGDDGEAALIRARAMGIEGLVFQQASAINVQPKLVGNVILEFGTPLLYYTIVGNDQLVNQVRWQIGGQVIHSSGSTSGKIALEGLPSFGSLELDGEALSESGATIQQLSLTLKLPIRPAPIAGSNTRPVLNTPAGQRITANHLLDFSVSASDEDGEAVELSASSLPEGSDFDTHTGQFTWLPTNDDAGEHLIEFTATDARGKRATNEVRVNVLYDASDSPVLASWDLNSPNPVVPDLSPNGNDGVLSEAEPRADGGLQFNGSNRVDLEANASLRPESELTIELWASPEGRTGFQDLIRYNSGSAAAYAIGVKDGGTTSLQGYYATLTTELGTTRILAEKTDWKTGEWDNVVLTYEPEAQNGRMRLYVNGTMRADATDIGQRILYKPFGSQTVMLGGGDDTDTGFSGGLSNARISATVIESDEVADRFTQGRSAAIPLTNVVSTTIGVDTQFPSVSQSMRNPDGDLIPLAAAGEIFISAQQEETAHRDAQLNQDEPHKAADSDDVGTVKMPTDGWTQLSLLSDRG